MQYFLTPDGQRHAFENGYEGQLITNDMSAITEAQYLALVTPAVAKLRADAWEAIKQERDRRVQNGGYKVSGKWFHSDTFSRTQQMGLVMLGANLPAGIQWKTLDGSFVTMTPALAGQIFAAGAASDISVFATAQAHRAAMEQLSDPTGYDFLSDWPVAFGEE